MIEKLRFLVSAAWEFLMPFILVLMSQIGPILAQAALDAVKFAASGNLSNAEKRATAFDLITDRMKKEGIEVGSSVVNMAIEAAVQKIKAG